LFTASFLQDSFAVAACLTHWKAACVRGSILSLIDTSVVGTRSAVELAALGPGTMLCDYSAYIFTFLAIASASAAVCGLCLFSQAALALSKTWTWNCL